MLMPLLARPQAAIAGAIGIVGLVLASRSVAYPIGLSGVPTIVIAILGSNPLPRGSVALLLFGWAALAILLELARDPRAIPTRVLVSSPLALSLALAVWMIVRLGASADQSYGSQKIQLFLASNVTLMVAGLLVARRPRHFELFVLLALLTAAGSALLLTKEVLSGHATQVFAGRYALAPGEHPIQFGRGAAEGIVLAVFVLLTSRSVRMRFGVLALAPILAIALIAAGSRGPVLGLFAGLVCYVLLVLRNRTSRRRLLLVAAGALLAAVLVPQLVPGQNIQRSLSVVLGSGSGLSSNGRFTLWSQAWHAFRAHPLFGIGTGGFGAVRPDELYPHNLVLETAAELGLVGLVLVVGTLLLGAVALVRAWRHDSRHHPEIALVATLAVSALVNAMLSADVQNNAELWLALGLAIGLAQRGTESAAAQERPPAPPHVARASA